MQIKDIFFIKTILDRATAGSHNGETGYYSVSDNMFSEGHSCYCDNGNDYYSDLKGIFDCSSTLSGTNWSSSDQHEFDSGHYSMTVVKMAANNYLSILVGGQNVSLNYDGNYYYTQNYYSNYGGTWFRWDYINGELTYIKTYFGGSYATIDENVETTLYSSMPIMMYYSNADRNVNYAQIAGDQGVGPGGWQVPNPNPTYKIMINGSEPDDIKLNGVTPDKIMLNGVCYYEKAPEPDPHNYLYKWDFTKSLVDEKQGAEATYYGSNAASITRDSEGIHINNTNQCVYLCSGVELVGKTVEISISDYSPVITPKGADSILCHCDDNRIYTIPYLYFSGASEHRWIVYGYYDSSTNTGYSQTISLTLSPTDLDNSVIKFIFGDDKGVSVYLNDSLIGTADKLYFNANSSHVSINNLYLLGKNANSGANNWYNMTISGVRIYENEE